MSNPNLPINTKFNTYIGARYVPIFANPIEWSATAKYEPLTIVTYQGNSYTSRTYVPAGIVPTNLAYWAPTGNYNAQVEQYRQEVLTVQNELDGIQNEVTENKLIPPPGVFSAKRKFIIVGDSYSTSYVKDNQSITPWINQFKTFYPASTFYVTALGGASLGYPEVNNRVPYITLFNNLLPSVENPEEITDIIIQAGGNELYIPQTNVQNGISLLQQAIETNCPKARVYLLISGIRMGENRQADNYKIMSRMIAYGNRAKWIVFTDTWHCLYNTYVLCSDGIHPNQSGQGALATTIFNQIERGKGFYQEYLNFNITGNLVGLTWADETGITIQLNFSTIKFDTPITITGGQWTNIGTCQQSQIYTHDRCWKVAVVLKIGTTWQQIDAWLKVQMTSFTNGGLSPSSIQIMPCNPYKPEDGSTVSYSVSEISFNPAIGCYHITYECM